MKRFGLRSRMIECGTETFPRHLDHIKPGVDQSQKEDGMPSGNREQGETTRQAPVPAPYMLDSPADMRFPVELEKQ